MQHVLQKLFCPASSFRAAHERDIRMIFEQDEIKAVALKAYERIVQAWELSQRDGAPSDIGDAVLSSDQSSWAWQLSKAVMRATDVLGSQRAAELWLLAPAMGLDNRRPIDLLATSAGAEAVENLLIRLDYGVYT